MIVSPSTTRTSRWGPSASGAEGVGGASPLPIAGDDEQHERQADRERANRDDDEIVGGERLQDTPVSSCRNDT